VMAVDFCIFHATTRTEIKCLPKLHFITWNQLFTISCHLLEKLVVRTQDKDI
jgi:hypothetical protein